MEVGYVEEDDEEGEEGAEETHNHEEAELGNVRQCAQADARRSSAQQACEARHACYLYKNTVLLKVTAYEIGSGHAQC